MKIVGTQLSDRRHDRRLSVLPIQIEIEGETYTATDWSLGGFLIEGYTGSLQPGEEVTIAVQVTAQGVDINHVVRAEVVRIDEHGNQLAANFCRLDSDVLDMLEGWLTGRLRRKPRRKNSG